VPYIFVIYVDRIVDKATGQGCHIQYTGVRILLYAADILLLAPSVHGLQFLFFTVLLLVKKTTIISDRPYVDQCGLAAI